jgi:hypothetical protein
VNVESMKLKKWRSVSVIVFTRIYHAGQVKLRCLMLGEKEIERVLFFAQSPSNLW